MCYEDEVKAKLRSWYFENKRSLPWRETTNPYFIWLSEIILQQTRIDQGLSYFNRFVASFPQVELLANASEDEVLKLWQGLGYYSRARNLHETAKRIAYNYKGIFPDTYTDILKLKGVGEYTAAAIASISFNQPYAVVDGNVYRVLSRLFGIETAIDSTEGKKIFWELAQTLLDTKHPGDHNQAIMEFGALHCTPKNPACSSCIFGDNCIALANSKTDKLPVKQGKTKIRHRYFNYIILSDNDSIMLKKRTDNDIWKNLYEFPLHETDTKTTAEEALEQANGLLAETTIIEISNWGKQTLSHQQIHYRFIHAELHKEKKLPPDLIKADKKDIFKFVVPKPIEQKLIQLGLV